MKRPHYKIKKTGLWVRKNISKTFIRKRQIETTNNTNKPIRQREPGQ